MTRDVVQHLGYLFLGSRFKRLGERLQADVLRLLEAAHLPIQPSHYPLLLVLAQHGPMCVSDIVSALGVSQPGVTRTLSRLAELNLVSLERQAQDQRHKMACLTDAGRDLIARSRLDIWPYIEAAVTDMAAPLRGSLLSQLGRLEQDLSVLSLDKRANAVRDSGLRIRNYTDELAPAFRDINVQWIEAMFKLEATDLHVLNDPGKYILAPGGDILFVELEGEGIVGTCALRKTGEHAFEVTKMGVLEAARGRKAGAFLLQAVLRRAHELESETLYLLTSAKCAAAIHLYEKLGFVHDAEIMSRYGATYARCDVAMRYRPI